MPAVAPRRLGPSTLDARRRHTNATDAGRRHPRSTDAGFTLLETMISIGLIGIVMTSLTMFLVGSLSATSRQGGWQAAAQLADDGTERVHALKGSALANGRDKTSSDQQWADPAPGVAAYLAGMQEAYDAGAAYPAGATAALPTVAELPTVNGIGYARHYYVGSCWQAAAGGDCGKDSNPGWVPFYRVVVAVVWHEAHCPVAGCGYLAATLVSSAAGDPTFNANETAQAPTITNPGPQVSMVGEATSVQLTATGAPPLTWSGSGLPAGLTLSSNGKITGTPTTGSAPVTVTVTVKDGFGLTGSAAITWSVQGGLRLVNPGGQASEVGLAVSLSIGFTGGVGAMTWTVPAPAALPAGLSINPSTGAITGTPSAAAPVRTVTVTVTDSAGGTDTVSFGWTVVAVLRLQAPGTQAGTVGSAGTVQLTATGGQPNYTWASTNRPPGVAAIDSTGKMAGTYTNGTRYLTTVTVTDQVGGSSSVTFVWNVSGSGMQITSPLADRTDPVNQFRSFTATAVGGNGNGIDIWSATGLPPGMSIVKNTGVVSGTPITPGTSIVTLTATAGGTKWAATMFVWTIQ
jgi:prepilin-type N-terminal cleavage/methylation domain-containing protein